jgi:hypothetical protein
VNEEIEPVKSLEPLRGAPSAQEITGPEDATIKELTKSLQGSHLQERRMSHFAFEPVSLPASRVCCFNHSVAGPRHSIKWVANGEGITVLAARTSPEQGIQLHFDFPALLASFILPPARFNVTPTH